MSPAARRAQAETIAKPVGVAVRQTALDVAACKGRCRAGDRGESEARGRTECAARQRVAGQYPSERAVATGQALGHRAGDRGFDPGPRKLQRGTSDLGFVEQGLRDAG